MKLNEYVTTGALALALLFAAAGCGNSNSTPTASNTTSGGEGATPGGTAQRPLKLAFVTNNASDYWTIARKGVEKAQRELPNDKITFVIPDQATAAAQKQKIDDLITTGVDGVAISPVDPATQTDQLDRWADKTLIVTQDSDAPNSKRTAYVGTDNVAAGKKEGEEILKALPNGGKIYAFVGNKDAANAHDRLQGIEEAIAGSKVQLVDVIQDQADHLKAKSNVQDVLVAHPDVAGLVGIWSYNGPAIEHAVQEAGKAGKIKIICFDEEPDTLDGVKSGVISATVVQHPFDIGYEAIKRMHAYLEGDKNAFPPNKLEITDTTVLHAADVDAFRKELDKVRNS